MYEVLDITPKDLFSIYAVLLGGCFTGYLLIQLIFNIFLRGTKWK